MRSLRAGLGFNPSAVPTGAAQARPLRCCRALRSSWRAGTRHSVLGRSAAPWAAAPWDGGSAGHARQTPPAPPRLGIALFGAWAIYRGALAGWGVLGPCADRCGVPASPGGEAGQPRLCIL